jgi:hypothetical protein
MTDNQRAGQPLHEGTHFPSPFTRVLALGYHDGPTNGLLKCGRGDQIYKFDRLDGDDVRIFALAPLPSPALEQLAEAYARYLTPHWPVWVPLWHFPTRADQEAMELLTDQVLQQAGPVEWVIATEDLLGESLAARSATSEEMTHVTDWFAFLGLPHEAAVKE